MTSIINEHTQFFDDSGNPLVGGLVYFGIVNLDPKINPTSIFSDRALATAATNPQVLDANGRTTDKIWLSARYSLRVATSADVQVYQELDNGTDSGTIAVLPLSNVTGANTIVATSSSGITSYTADQMFIFETASANTGAVTLNIDGTGAKDVVKAKDKPLVAADLPANYEAVVIYNATSDDFELINPIESAIIEVGSVGGTADVITGAGAPTITAYETNKPYMFTVAITNTASATLNIDSVGAKTLKKYGSTNLIANELEVGNIVVAVYDGTNFQVISGVANNNLEAFAGLGAVADRLAYFDGSSSMNLTLFTSLARGLLNDATTAEMQTTLELILGTHVQAQDAGLQSIADITPPADRMLYTASSNTYAAAVLTSQGRAICGDSTAAQNRGTIGVPENTKNITSGTGAPGSLTTDHIYLRREA